MKIMRRILLILFMLAAGRAAAQLSNTVTIVGIGAPVGTCSAIMRYVDTGGNLYYCPNGAWVGITGGSTSPNFATITSAIADDNSDNIYAYNKTYTLNLLNGLIITQANTGVIYFQAPLNIGFGLSGLEFVISNTGNVTTYGSTATVGSGLPAFVGHTADTGFSTTQGSANVLTSSAAATQEYRVGYSMWQATSGSGGTCATNATATVALGWTDPASQTHTFTAGAMSALPTLAAGTMAGPCLAAIGAQGCSIVIVAKASTAITRTITWANGNCSTQPTVSGLFYAESVN